MTLRRLVIQFEVLYDTDDIDWFGEADLGSIYAETIDGAASGNTTVISDEEVSKKRMAELLVAQGSDPSFLLGDEEDEE